MKTPKFTGCQILALFKQKTSILKRMLNAESTVLLARLIKKACKVQLGYGSPHSI